jgi:hypothetical protein
LSPIVSNITIEPLPARIVAGDNHGDNGILDFLEKDILVRGHFKRKKKKEKKKKEKERS